MASLPRWIRLLASLDGGLPTNVVRQALEAGYIDLFRSLHPVDPGATLPAWAPTVRLDHLLAARPLAGWAVACAVGGAATARLVAASDHLSLVLDLASPASDPAAEPGQSQGGP